MTGVNVTLVIRYGAYALAAMVAALLTATVSDKWLSYQSSADILLFGAVMGFLNAFIRPVLGTISFPITCLTFGLFSLVLNALLFALGAALVPGITVSGFGAFAGAITSSIAVGLVFSVFDE